MNQSWNPTAYATDARFVFELAGDVVSLLAPQVGERILDLGCGNGALSRKLVDSGCQVVGVDASPEMVEAAVGAGLDARLMDGHSLTFDGEFDAVFSNASLHWMKQPDRVIAGVRRALKRGGRFVGEFGGHGNIAVVMEALRIELRERGFGFDDVSPWYFPTDQEYRTRLEAAALRVGECRLVPRPTALSTDLVAWLRVFARTFMEALPESDHDAFLADVSARCESRLRDRNGQWHVDYVRLRFTATKRDAA
jgi:SAM-dependent methyltransferase